MDARERMAKLFGEPPARRETEHGSGQARAGRIWLDQAEILLHQAAGEFERIAGRCREIPFLPGEAVAEAVTRAGEPSRVVGGKMGRGEGQHRVTGGGRPGQGREDLSMPLREQAAAEGDLFRVVAIDLEKGGDGNGDQAHGHPPRPRLEGQIGPGRREFVQGGAGHVHGGQGSRGAIEGKRSL